ncbi:MAG TPA: hypothetical protein VMB03_29455 [Bryobacteraceae bacterium]|nr:hypothetical protein [Bryobacteraceae bacterium]
MSDKAHENLLTSTAKTIGATAGKIASLAGVAGAAPEHKHSGKPAKLARKNKPRLPRRVKKAQKKAAAKAQARA